MAEIKLSLLENAHCFIVEAVSKAILAQRDSIHWKYAILNLVQAIELSLKELLLRQHPALIYKDIDKPYKTVSLEFAQLRLEKIGGVMFDDADVDLIKKASEYRNQIVHYKFAFKETDLKLVFAKLLGFLQQFHTSHFEQSLNKIIPCREWHEVLVILEWAQELFLRAQVRFNDEQIDSNLIWVCRHCCWESFVVQDGRNN